MAHKKNKKSSRKRRKARKDSIPFSHVRKKLPRPGGSMESKKTYKRKSKYEKDWE